MEIPLFGIVITLIFSAFFSGMETAYISSNRLKVELDKSKSTINAKILGVFYKKESFFIAMLLLGNNISLVFFGLYSAKMLGGVILSWGITGDVLTLLIQTIISTVLVLVVAEFLPKAFVQISPNRFLSFTTGPMIFIYCLLYVPTQMTLWLSSFFLSLLRVDHTNTKKVFSKFDLEEYVDEINERITRSEELGNEVKILRNALDFDKVKARDCMVPRIDIISISIEEKIDSLRNKFIDSGKSKILVYRDSVDNIIGYVHSFEMFKSPKSIKQILLPILFVPEATLGKELLSLFTEKSGNIAVVVDEYGVTAGVITIEDVIEEIFGEIEDEHDKEKFIEEKISKTEFRFSARLEIDYLNDAYQLDLPVSEDYGTLGGMIINKTESIPESGSHVEINDLDCFIEKVRHNRIEVVKIKK